MDKSIFKAYDIRGIYPQQIDAEIAYKIGQGYADFVKPTKPVAVGRDVRLHSEELQQAVIKGLVDAGIDVIDIGLISTEMLYFAVGKYELGGGISATASHNPAEWQGFKMVREGVNPISKETGLTEIKEFVKSNQKITSPKKGQIASKNTLDDFCNYLLSWIDKNSLKKIKLVFNANFGYEGKVLQRLVEIGSLPVDLVPLNAEPDGHFPKGRPDPFVPENRVEFVALVKETGADLGVAWDADADRVFFSTDEGNFVDPYYTNTLLIKSILSSHPKQTVIYEPRNNWATIDQIKKSGGNPILERVGHSFIKARMRQENAIFASESSGHTFFRDFWFSDSGMIPFLLIWELVSKENKKLSEMIKPVMEKNPISGEINFKTDNKDQIMRDVQRKYADAEISQIDGITLEYPTWRANIRASNTEPLLRLNIEAKSAEILAQKRDELVDFIKQNA